METLKLAQQNFSVALTLSQAVAIGLQQPRLRDASPANFARPMKEVPAALIAAARHVLLHERVEALTLGNGLGVEFARPKET